MTKVLLMAAAVLMGCGGQPFSAADQTGLISSGGSNQLDAGGSSASGGRSNSLEQTAEAGSPDDVPDLTGFVADPSVLVQTGAAGRALKGSFRLLLTAQSTTVTVSTVKFKLVNDIQPVIDPLATTHDGVAFPLTIDAGATKSGTFSFELDAVGNGLCDGPVRIVGAIGDVVIESDAVVATCN